MRLRRLAVALLALVAAREGIEAKPKRVAPSPPPAPATAEETPHAAVVEGPDGRRIDLAVDGPLWGWAAPRVADGSRALYLLVGPPGLRAATSPACVVSDATADATPEPGRLFVWRADAPAALNLVRTGVPAGSLEAACAGDGSATDQLLLVRPGTIAAVRTDSADGSATQALIEDAELGHRLGDPRLTTGVEGDRMLREAVVGSFRSWSLAADGSARIQSSLDLPVVVDAGRAGLRVLSPDVVPVGRATSGRALYATAPAPVGFERLRTILLDPDGPAESRSLECWSLLPDRERTLESAFAILDGKPALVAMTISADKLSLFGGKRLRVFALGADRTRTGSAPLLAADTDVNLWQPVTPVVTDLDGDGRDDLVLGYWKGLTGSIAALEIRRRNADGSFAKPRTVEMDVADGDRGFIGLGRDLDGDRRPDLGLVAGGAFRVYPGTAPALSTAHPFETRPSRVIPLASGLPAASGLDLEFRVSAASFSVSRAGKGAGSPRFVDFDGDGLPEVLFVGDGERGAHATVVFVRRPS